MQISHLDKGHTRKRCAPAVARVKTKRYRVIFPQCYRKGRLSLRRLTKIQTVIARTSGSLDAKPHGPIARPPASIQ